MRDEIRTLLDAGWSRRAIARTLGVDPSTVTRYARLLGFPDVRTRRSKFDWTAVQKHYDAGHTIGQCRERFGFSYGAWDKAAVRGDIVSRPRSERQLSHQSRDRVEQLLAREKSQAEAAAELGLSKSTIAYHCRQLGRDADARFARRYDWSEVQRAIDEEGLSMTRCRERFGFCLGTWRGAVRRGQIVPRQHVVPIGELLVAGRRRSRGHIKARLIREGVKSNNCESCGLSEWLDKPIGLELHHVNGDGNDHRIENLMLLCGNCHSQTANWGGRGIRKSDAAQSPASRSGTVRSMRG